MANLSIKRIDRGNGKELILFSQNPINIEAKTNMEKEFFEKNRISTLIAT